MISTTIDFRNLVQYTHTRFFSSKSLECWPVCSSTYGRFTVTKRSASHSKTPNSNWSNYWWTSSTKESSVGYCTKIVREATRKTNQVMDIISRCTVECQTSENRISDKFVRFKISCFKPNKSQHPKSELVRTQAFHCIPLSGQDLINMLRIQ